jgi:hypothetical protein
MSDDSPSPGDREATAPAPAANETKSLPPARPPRLAKAPPPQKRRHSLQTKTVRSHAGTKTVRPALQGIAHPQAQKPDAESISKP